MRTRAGGIAAGKLAAENVRQSRAQQEMNQKRVGMEQERFGMAKEQFGIAKQDRALGLEDRTREIGRQDKADALLQEKQTWEREDRNRNRIKWAVEDAVTMGVPNDIATPQEDGSVIVTTPDGRKGIIKADRVASMQRGGKGAGGMTDYQRLQAVESRGKGLGDEIKALSESLANETNPTQRKIKEAVIRSKQSQKTALMQSYDAAIGIAGAEPDPTKLALAAEYDDLLENATKSGLFRSSKIGKSELAKLDRAWQKLGIEGVDAPHRGMQSAPAGIAKEKEQESNATGHVTLDPSDEKQFQEWYQTWAKRSEINPDPDDPRHKYDYRAAFKAGVEPAVSPEDGKYHWSSQFKDDDHPNRFVDGKDTKNGDSATASVTPTSQRPEYQALKRRENTEIPGLAGQNARAERFSRGVDKAVDGAKRLATVVGNEFDMSRRDESDGPFPPPQGIARQSGSVPSESLGLTGYAEEQLDQELVQGPNGQPILDMGDFDTNGDGKVDERDADYRLAKTVVEKLKSGQDFEKAAISGRYDPATVAQFQAIVKAYERGIQQSVDMRFGVAKKGR